MNIGSKIKAPADWIMSKGIEILKTAIEEKFKEPSLQTALLETQGLIVEATRHTIYGIGLPFTSKDLPDKSTWQGGNLIGSDVN